MQSLDGMETVKADQYVRNSEGELLSSAEDGSRYIVKQWYADRECDLKDEKELLSAARALALLHRQFREVKRQAEWNMRSMVSPPLFEAMRRHNRELRRARTFIRGKRKKNEFELCVIRNFECFAVQAEEAEQGMERLYEKGYFLDLPPIPNVVRAIQQLYEQHSCDIYILSAVVDSPFAVPEKNEWLDRYLPEISKSRRLFIPCGENKAEYVPYGVRETDVLLDDYTKNLLAWPEKGVKLLNGINHTNGRWRGDCLDASLNPDELLQQLVSCLPENQPAFTYDTGDYEIE